MINKTQKYILGAVASVAACSTLAAGEVVSHSYIKPCADDCKLTGSVALDWNSHFISYGADVWGGGDDAFDEDTFNPAVSFNYKYSDRLSFNTGFWLDLNDNDDATGFNVNETDVWVGLEYTTGIATIAATFQNWQYGGDSEEVFDLGVSFDTFLSPSLLLHKRLDQGASGGFNGTFAVLGLEHGFDLTDKFSVSIPASVGVALDEFHTTESGYGYFSVGLQGSYALSGASALNFGATYYDTDDEVVGNAEESFVTYNLGVSFDF